jgi:hypothetical protein
MVFKRTFIIFSAFAALASVAPVSAGDADFTLVNRTGFAIREVYLSASRSSNWGNDRLGEGTLGNGRQRLFKFSDKASCKQDLQVVFDDDASEVVWENFDLCEINKITLKYNRSTKAVSADTE